MQLIIKLTEVKGWPRMFVENLITNSGDSVRLQNWALDRRRDFEAICKEHARATELAVQATKQGRAYRGTTLRGMFETIFSQPKDSYVPQERGTVANTKQLREDAKKFISDYVITDTKQVYTNGMELVPLQRVEDMLGMMKTGDFTYKGC